MSASGEPLGFISTITTLSLANLKSMSARSPDQKGYSSSDRALGEGQ
jgi:hypothetical protein